MPVRYRAGIVGAGRIADGIDEQFRGVGMLLPLSHMGSYAEVPELQVVGVADPDRETRERFVDRWSLGGEHGYGSVEELLTSEQLDVVSICTTAGPRAAIIGEILDLIAAARCQVRCIWAEKPLALSLHDADQLVDRCRDAGVLLITNTQRCSDPYFRRVRALVDAGEIGEVSHLVGSYQGKLSHNGVHMIAAMCFLAGGPEVSGRRVEWVMGHAESDEAVAGDDDFRGDAYFGMTDGIRGILRMAPPGRTTGLDVIGSKATVAISDFDGSCNVEILRDAPIFPGAWSSPQRHPLPRPSRIFSGGVGQVYDIVHCLDTGAEPRTPGELGRHLLEVVIAIRESHRRGNVRVDLPLTDRSLIVRSQDALAGGTTSAIRQAMPPLVSGPLADVDGTAADLARR